MTAMEHLKAAQQSELIDEDGEKVALKLLPPLSAGQIDAMQQQAGLPLPEELRSLLAFCSGLEGCLDVIDFTGQSVAFAQEEVFPHGLPFAGDGFGNFWVLDLTPQTVQAAPVFFACHDAPVILFQSPSLASFVAEVIRMDTPPYESLINDVHNDRICQVWRKNPGVIAQPAAASSADPVLRAFALGLPEHFQIVDLRQAEPGMGFSWGRHGPRTEIRRHGWERIFAYGKPPRTGLLARIFGR